MKTRRLFAGFCQGLALSLAALPFLWAPRTEANLSGAEMSTFASAPIEIVQNVPPLVMLTMSLDHQYWLKAYNDYTDLTGDGDIERTYDDSFEYYGYFHAERCYRYSDSDNAFEAVGVAGGTNDHYCSGTLDDAWSGNFLNWATMTRMDIVRKILYGGYRSTDTATATVLERAHLPGDAHAFAKYYNGADIDDLVPYSSLKVDGDNGGDADGIDDIDEGITICNISRKSSGSSQGTTGATPTETPDPAPMMRVVQENHQLWNANERRQCSWDNENGDNSNSNNSAESGVFAVSNDPSSSKELESPGGSRDQIVRVKVCESTFFGGDDNLENCTAYGSNLKPEGLLQRYGLAGQINFGLMTGSYAKNISGGVLRKNVGSMSDEVSTTDGTFIAKTGSQVGIIRTLNAMRIYGYSYNNGTYGADSTDRTAGGDDCTFQLTDITEGKCRSWGNPISEIFYESLRYFAVSSGRGPTSAFNATDSSSIAGLVQDSWTTDPLNTDNFCASLNSIVFNASVSSYDNDSAVYGTTFGSVTTTTKAVGDGEGITGNDFFVGRTATDTNEFCTSKEITSLGEASGLCPEAPTVRGSYHMAGLAHYAHTNDLRTSAAFKGDQTVNTFAVSLATSTPVIDVPIGASVAAADKIVKILPAYRLRKGGNNTNEASNVPANDGGGALVDFRIVVPHLEVVDATSTTAATGTGHFYAKFYVNWEDSEQGGDYDQDMWGTIEYRVDTNVSPATVRIITKTVAESTVTGQLFGFVVSGTTQDGFHAYSGIEGANYFASVGTDPTGVPGCSNCRALSETGGQRGAQAHTFTVSATGASGILESPLFYAAKWGGFKDLNDNDEPDLADEWDAKDTSGAEVDGGDGIPDNFFFVTNPGALESALNTIFLSILERVSSGTSAAVVANDRVGNGALFQAIYDPSRKDGGGNEVKWIGTLHGLWVDADGFIREDGGLKGVLEDYNTDKVVDLFYDVTERKAKLRRFSSSKDDEFVESSSSVAELTELKTIWNAREQLSAIDEGSLAANRGYDDPADEGRFILTWMDTDTDGAVDTGEAVALEAGGLTTSNFMWVDADDVDEAEDLVNWTRGIEVAGLRKRVLDYAGDGTTETIRLGDIVHSTPISVEKPREAFDIVFGDDSYRDFRRRYENRRQVVYVGSNDGMIHAFNAGFFNAADKTFELDTGFLEESPGSETNHPLGAELWAYVPKNLLPHLQWSARTDYSHVYGVDNAARVFDVKIFADDGASGTHPGGWGTILVATMAYGGGSDATGITVDTEQDGVGAANADGDTRDDVKTKSAVVILDITNPEDPPVVLAELAPANLQFTTSVPQAVVVNNVGEGGEDNKWFLVVGTGPSDLASASYLSGASNANIFVYDLSKLGDGLDDVADVTALAGLVETKELPDTTADGDTADKNANMYIGDITGVDYNFNYKSDAIYFGTVGASSDLDTVNHGGLFRISMNEEVSPDDWTAPFRLVSDLNQPFSEAPTLQLDDRLRRWVIAASGRFETTGDKSTVRQQTMIGVIDTIPNGSDALDSVVDADTLFDVTNARVFSSGGVSFDGTTTPSTTLKAVTADIISAGGWRRDFDASATTPAQRGVSGMTAIGGIILVPAFTPDTAVCTAEGSSILLGLSPFTGMPTLGGVFGDIPCDCDDGVTELPPSPMVGSGTDPDSYEVVTYEGKLEKPSVTRSASSASDRGLSEDGDEDPTGGRACATTSTAAIACEAIDFDDQIFNGEISWREHRSAE